MNHIHLIGRLGADPRIAPYAEHKQPKSEDKPRRNTVSFDIAVDRAGHHPSTGEVETDWIPITVFDGPAGRFASQHLKKGDRVAVTGRLAANVWAPDEGPARKVMRVVAAEVIGLDGRRRTSNESTRHREEEPAQ